MSTITSMLNSQYVPPEAFKFDSEGSNNASTMDSQYSQGNHLPDSKGSRDHNSAHPENGNYSGRGRASHYRGRGSYFGNQGGPEGRHYGPNFQNHFDPTSQENQPRQEGVPNQSEGLQQQYTQNPQYRKQYSSNINDDGKIGQSQYQGEWDLRSMQNKRTPHTHEVEEADEDQWDEGFQNTEGGKKFELGRVLERDQLETQSYQCSTKSQIKQDDDIASLQNQLMAALSMEPSLKAKVIQPIKGRIVKTTDIDLFLNCDEMSAEELMRIDDSFATSKQKDEEEDPEWGDVEIQHVKQSKDVGQVLKVQKVSPPDFDRGALTSAQIPQEFNSDIHQQQWLQQDDAIISVKSQQRQVQKQNSSELCHHGVQNDRQHLLDLQATKMSLRNNSGLQPLPYEQPMQGKYNNQDPYSQNLTQASQYIPPTGPLQFNSNPFANESFLHFLMSRQNPMKIESKWFYKDPTGIVRGPFTQQQMAQWYEFGYFADDLHIAFGENSMFLPLQQYKEINMKQGYPGILFPGQAMPIATPPQMNGAPYFVPPMPNQFANPAFPSNFSEFPNGMSPHNMYQQQNNHNFNDIYSQHLPQMMYQNQAGLHVQGPPQPSYYYQQ